MTLSWKDFKKFITINPLVMVLCCGVIIAGFFVLNSIRWTPPIIGGIAELTSVEINGTKQWLLIRGQKKDAPIILFVHGGAGDAQIGVFRQYQRELEKNYIVVQWDQRGSGLSGVPFPDRATLHLGQFVDDGISVVAYLKERFRKEKIYLVGHAGGTGIAWFMARDYPEHFYAYAAFNQIAPANHQTFQYIAVLAEAERRQHTKAVAELQELGSPPWKFMPDNPDKNATDPSYASMLKVLKWAKVFQESTHHHHIDHIFARDLIFSTEYTLKDVISWAETKHRAMNIIYPWVNANLRLIDKGVSFEIPFYMFLAEKDLITPPAPADLLFENIQAPNNDKKIVIYPNTSHYIFWERTKEYQAALLRVFNKH
ncbi:MAG: alpha/beta fold hydrolase [Brevinema sp.]